jgi:hypothetical protein
MELSLRLLFGLDFLAANNNTKLYDFVQSGKTKPNQMESSVELPENCKSETSFSVSEA